MNALITIILLVLNIPVYKLIFGMIFKSMEDFNESLRYVFTPDIFSLFRGEYGRDYIGEMKVSLLFVICGGVVYFEYSFIQLIIGKVFG